jgi:RNA polymerase subunit RPABC4/transcription elongation factor Spt4
VVNSQNDECCICMDTENTSEWLMLPCGHKFHRQCISTWLHTNQTCPICRLHTVSFEQLQYEMLPVYLVRQPLL